MSVTNLQENIHNRQLAIYNYSMSSYDADKFADWLTEAFNGSQFKSFAALAEEAKISRSAVSALANSKKQSLTDKPSQPKIETVISLAKALNIGTDEARGKLVADYAPEVDTANNHEIMEGITVQINPEKVSKAEQDKIVEAMRMVAIGAKTTLNLNLRAAAKGNPSLTPDVSYPEKENERRTEIVSINPKSPAAEKLNFKGAKKAFVKQSQEDALNKEIDEAIKKAHR